MRDLVILLLHEKLANLFGYGEFAMLFALANALPVITDRIGLIDGIET